MRNTPLVCFLPFLSVALPSYVVFICQVPSGYNTTIPSISFERTWLWSPTYFAPSRACFDVLNGGFVRCHTGEEKNGEMEENHFNPCGGRYNGVPDSVPIQFISAQTFSAPGRSRGATCLVKSIYLTAQDLDQLGLFSIDILLLGTDSG
jgi:hypothetical protein